MQRDSLSYLISIWLTSIIIVVCYCASNLNLTRVFFAAIFV